MQDTTQEPRNPQAATDPQNRSANTKSTGNTQQVEVRVERMAYGSDAIAHLESGKTAFVSGAVPGDLVRCTVREEGPSFDRLDVIQVLEPSPDRVQPACPMAGICDGCPWSSIARPAQLAAKRDNVVSSLEHVGHFSAEEAHRLVASCEAPSDSWGYRNKIELGFSRSKRNATIGMHAAQNLTPERLQALMASQMRTHGKKSKHRGMPALPPITNGLVKVDTCPLLDKKHQGLAKSISGAVTYLANSHSLDFERIGIRASSRTGQVEVALWTQPGPFPRAQAAKLINDATQGAVTSVVRVMTKGPSKARKIAGVEVLGGKGHWEEILGDERMLISAPSFFQVNTAGAETLQRLVLDALKPGPDDEAMDLYSGAGTFTLPLARRCGWVSAVESYGPAVRDLRRNLDHACISNADPIGGDANLEFPDTDADIIVVDPPRAGLAPEVVQKLSDQPARAIAYVSCDPATLARDLARFRELGVFEPVRVTPVDLFPQTYHVETVTQLVRA